MQEQDNRVILPFDYTNSCVADDYTCKKKETILKQGKYLYNKNLTEARYKKYGAFTFAVFKYCEEYMPMLSMADLVRTIYLSTFIGYDGVIYDKQNHAVKRTGVARILGLESKNTNFVRFYSVLKEQHIIYEQNKIVYFNRDLFFKGAKEISVQLPYIRIKHETIRALYESTPKRKISAIGYFFKLIPYISRETNIACFNPEEIDITKIDFISDLTDIAKICGYAPENSRRFFINILSLNHNGQYLLMSLFNEYTHKRYIIINPHLYYGGKDYKSVEMLGVFGNETNEITK